MLVGKIHRFGTVIVGVVKLPFVLIEMALARQRRVQRDRLPAVGPHAARAEHRIILLLLLRRRVGLGVEAVFHRLARQRMLLHAAEGLGHFDTECFAARRPYAGPTEEHTSETRYLML